MNKKIKSTGFSLMEMSIVLFIVSIVISSGLVVLNKYSAQSKNTETWDKMQQVMLAIKQYAIKNKRLPCPADPTFASSNANYGLERTSVPSPPCNPGLGAGVGPIYYIGMVPFAELNIYPSMAVDAWGRRFTYVIKKTKANANNLAGDDGLYAEVANTGGTRFGNSDAVMVLISHGENGYGAYNGRGGSQISCTGANGFESNNCTGGFFYGSLPHNGFDDLVTFWTYRQIMNTILMK